MTSTTLPNRLGVAGSPMDRAQTIVEAHHGPVASWTRTAHEQCSAIARMLCGIDETPPKFTRERHARASAA
jgi:hypothetical protein